MACDILSLATRNKWKTPSRAECRRFPALWPPLVSRLGKILEDFSALYLDLRFYLVNLSFLFGNLTLPDGNLALPDGNNSVPDWWGSPMVAKPRLCDG